MRRRYARARRVRPARRAAHAGAVRRPSRGRRPFSATPPCAAQPDHRPPPRRGGRRGAGTPADTPCRQPPGSGGYGRRRHSRMQTAFARLRLLPPPAAGTAALAGLNRAGAWGAPDARKLAIVEPIVRQAPRADVLPHLGLGPIEQRAHLVQAMLRVPLQRLAAGASRRVLAAHTRDPAAVAGDRAFEGLHFTNAAAFEARLEAVIEAVHTLLRHQPLERLGVRVDDPDGAPVAALQSLEELVGLLVQAPGIDAEDLDLRQVGPDVVGEHHGLGPQAVRVHQPALVAQRVAEARAQARRLVFQVGCRHGSHGAWDYNDGPVPHRTNDCF